MLTTSSMCSLRVPHLPRFNPFRELEINKKTIRFPTSPVFRSIINSSKELLPIFFLICQKIKIIGFAIQWTSIGWFKSNYSNHVFFGFTVFFFVSINTKALFSTNKATYMKTCSLNFVYFYYYHIPTCLEHVLVSVSNIHAMFYFSLLQLTKFK